MIHLSIIIQAKLVELAREICHAIAGEAGQGMFVVGLSADGCDPPSHFISAGLVHDRFALLSSSPQALFAAVAAAGLNVTFEQVNELMSSVIVGTDGPQNVMRAHGLVVVVDDFAGVSAP